MSGIDANDRNFENPDNVTDVLYLLGASGATEVDHVNHPDFAHNFIDFIAKGSRDHEMNSTTNFWRGTGYSLTQRIHYDVLEGALGDGVLESGTCSGDDLVLSRTESSEPRHRAGRLRWGRWWLVTTGRFYIRRTESSGVGGTANAITLSDRPESLTSIASTATSSYFTSSARCQHRRDHR